MKNKKYGKYPHYVWLSYFRWRFLIESPAYKDFLERHQIAALERESEKLVEERAPIFTMTEETREGLRYKYSLAQKMAWDEFGEKEDEDVEDRIEEIIEEKSGELLEQLNAIENRLHEISKKTTEICREARTRFRLMTATRELSQFLPVEGCPQDHIKPRFIGHERQHDSAMMKQAYAERKDCNFIVRTVKPHNQFGIDRHMLINPFVFAIDGRFLEHDELYPVIIESFEKKLEEIKGKRDRTESVSPAKERKRFKEWEEFLQAYKLRQHNKKNMEIARIMGAEIIDGKIIFTGEEIDKKGWNMLYGRSRSGEYGDNFLEKQRMRSNIQKKVEAAKKLMEDAGNGTFRGFDIAYQERVLEEEKVRKAYDRTVAMEAIREEAMRRYKRHPSEENKKPKK